ncbi:MAG: MFS transporter [Thauera phenolivorans]|uniref:MFS transporter n=1 Tax=Thauera phenolivorans TaxID=1792543 RepID=A0A7X7LXL7_9RHOO|nr:MFS transporter [Thauera phenolivorans]
MPIDYPLARPPDSTTSQLWRGRRFTPLFVTQFLGAFNDNAFKSALLILIAYGVLKAGTLSPALLVNLCAALFILPFVLFSAAAGRLADSADKAAIARATKLLEFAVMALGALGFMLGSVAVLLLALFLMGLQSTLFGPVKYALLPQHLGADELMRANGWIEAGTFVAILLGTVAGGLMAAGGDAARLPLGLACMTIAAAGYLASRWIPPAPPATPGRPSFGRPLADTGAILRLARSERGPWLALLAISWFWFVGATFLTLLPVYTRDTLGGDEAVVTLLLGVFTVGVGLGAFLAARWCRGEARPAPVIAGAAGITLAGLDLWAGSPSTPGSAVGVAVFLADPASLRVVFDCALVSVAGGLFSLPLYTHLQQRCPLERLGRMIAALNVVNAGFMVAAAGFAAALLAAGAGVPEVWLATALLNLAVAGTIGLRWRRTQRAA